MTGRGLASRWLLAAALSLAAVPVSARADSDPASDVLITATVFAPYAPKATPALLHELAGLAESARRQRHPIRVALIASGDDLGAYPMLFGRPQRYALLLAA